MAKYGLIYSDGEYAEIVVGDHISPLVAAAEFARTYNSDIEGHYLSVIVGETNLPIGSHRRVDDDGYLETYWDASQGRTFLEGEVERSLYAARQAIENRFPRAAYILHPYDDSVLTADGSETLVGDHDREGIEAYLDARDVGITP